MLEPILPPGFGVQAATPQAPPLPQLGFATPPGLLPPVGVDAVPPGTFNPNVPPPTGPHGLLGLVGGFGGNVLGGIHGIATGLSSMIGMGLHDVGMLASFGHQQGSYQVPQFLKALPGGIAHQYASFYGPLVQGDVGKFIHNVYDDPLQPLLDVLGASNIVGKAAVGVGIPGMAARATGLSPGAVAARTAFAEGGVASEAYQAVRAAEAAGEPATAARLLVAAQQQAGIPQWVRRVAPGIGTEFPGGSRIVQVGNEFRPVGYTYSPAKRLLLEKPLDRLLTQPIGTYDQRISNIGFDPFRSNEQARLAGIVQKARDLGMTRLDRMSVQDWRLRRAADALFAFHGTRIIERREDLLSRFAQVFRNLSPVELSSAHLNFFGIDLVPEKFRTAFEPDLTRYYDAEGNAVVSGRPTPDMLAKEASYREAMAQSGATLLQREARGSDILATKVVDDRGMPVRVYHGTATTFEDFHDPTGDNLYGPGIYTTEDPGVASQYTEKAAAEWEQGRLSRADPQTIIAIAHDLKQHLLDSGAGPNDAMLGYHHRYLDRMIAGDVRGAAPGISALVDDATGLGDSFPQNILTEHLGAPERQVKMAYLHITNPFVAERTLLGKEADALRAGTALMEGWSESLKARVLRTVGRLELIGAPLEQVYRELTYEIGSQRIREMSAEDVAAVAAGGMGGLVGSAPYRQEQLIGRRILNRLLERSGFDGISHVGGGRMGDHSHRVWIALHGDQVLTPWVRPENELLQRMALPDEERYLVRDRAGRPVVFYHGTHGEEEFPSFARGSEVGAQAGMLGTNVAYLATPHGVAYAEPGAIAGEFTGAPNEEALAEHMGIGAPSAEELATRTAPGARIRMAYLMSRRPFRFEEGVSPEEGAQIIAAIKAHDLEPAAKAELTSIVRRFVNHTPDRAGFVQDFSKGSLWHDLAGMIPGPTSGGGVIRKNLVNNILRSAGYDALSHYADAYSNAITLSDMDSGEVPAGRAWAVFDPENQIKQRWTWAEKRTQVAADVAAGKPVPFMALSAFPDLPGGQRARFMHDLVDSMSATQMPEDHTHLGMFLFDKIAAGAVEHRPDLYPTEDAFYAKLGADARAAYEVHPIEAFDAMVARNEGVRLDVAEQKVVRELYGQIGPITRELNRWLPHGWPEAWSDNRTGQAIRMVVLDARRAGTKLTPEMIRARVEGGAKGMMRFGPQGYAFLRLFSSADLGTLVHEGAHLIRSILPPDDLAALERYYRVEGGTWSVDAEERFARDAERYMASGAHPGGARIWKQIHSTLRSIYQKLRDYLGHERMVAPEVKAVLEKWFGPTKADDSLAARVYGAGYDSPLRAKIAVGAAARTKVSWSEQTRVRRLDWGDRAAVLLDQDPSPATPADRLAAELTPDEQGRVADGTSTDLPPRNVERPPFERTLAGRPFTIGGVGAPDAPPAPFVDLDPATVQGAMRSFHADSAAAYGGGDLALVDLHEATPDTPYLGTTQAHYVAAVTIPDWGQVADYRARTASMGRIVGVHDLASASDETGYRGVHYDVERPDGSVVQVRVHTPLSWRAYRAVANRLRPEDTPVLTLLRHDQAEAASIRSALATGKGPRGDVIEEADRPHLTDRLAELEANVERGLPYVRMLYEPVVHELTEQLEGVPRSPTDRAREDARLLTHETLTAPMLGKTLTIQDAFNRHYIALRMATGASMDYDSMEWVGGMDPLDIHYQRQAAGMHSPIYFPLQDATRLKFSDYLLGKNLVGARSASKGSFLRRAGGRLIERGAYVTNPTEVFQRRAAQAIRMAETWDMVNSVISRFSRNLNEEAAKHFDATGEEVSPVRLVSEEERLYAPDGLLRFFRGKIALDDWLDHAIAAGASEDEALKAALGKIMPHIHDDVRHYVGVTRKDIPLYAIPKVVAEQLEKQIAPFFTRGKGFRLFWNKGTDVWKSTVLVGSPRWVVNNLIGNIAFLKLLGGKLTDVVRQFEPGYRHLWEETLGLQSGIDTGLYRSQETYKIKAGAAGARPSSRSAAVAEQMSKWWTDSLPGKGIHRYAQAVIKANALNETAFRRAAYMSSARRVGQEVGLATAYRSFMDSKSAFETVASVGATPALHRRAMDLMNYAMNDYQKLTPWARHFIKPFLFPFWSFYRHVAKLVLTLPFEAPDRLQLLNQMAKVGTELTAGYGPLPDFLQGAVVWGPDPNDKGKVRFLSTSGPNPFNSVFQSPLSLLHPLLKAALEEASGRTALSNFSQTFTAPDVVTPFGSSQQFRVSPDGAVTPVSHVAPSILEELLRQVPQYQMAENLVAGGSPYSTTGLLHPVARTSAHTPGVPVYPADPVQQLLKLLGFSTLDYNVGRYQAGLQHDEQAALVLRLRELGLVPPAASQPLQPIVPP